MDDKLRLSEHYVIFLSTKSSRIAADRGAVQWERRLAVLNVKRRCYCGLFIYMSYICYADHLNVSTRCVVRVCLAASSVVSLHSFWMLCEVVCEVVQDWREPSQAAAGRAGGIDDDLSLSFLLPTYDSNMYSTPALTPVLNS